LTDQVTGIVKYPEHIRLKAVVAESQAIGQFIEWMTQEKNWVIADWVELSDIELIDQYRPVSMSIEAMLAEYFQIDLKKIEAEKQAMLEEIRQHREAGT
jgi:hypothetical protein